MFEFSSLFTHRENRPKTVAALITVTSAVVVGLMSAAVARDDAGVRQFFQNEAGRKDEPALRVAVSSVVAERHHASLTIQSIGRPPPRRVASRKPVRSTRVAVRRPEVAAPSLFAADPRRPAVVSVYEDPTLRRGDAVMTFAGLRVFAGSQTFPYRPEDFTVLTKSPSIKGQLRRALIELDQIPLRG